MLSNLVLYPFLSPLQSNPNLFLHPQPSSKCSSFNIYANDSQCPVISPIQSLPFPLQISLSHDFSSTLTPIHHTLLCPFTHSLTNPEYFPVTTQIHNLSPSYFFPHGVPKKPSFGYSPSEKVKFLGHSVHPKASPVTSPYPQPFFLINIHPQLFQLFTSILNHSS